MEQQQQDIASLVVKQTLSVELARDKVKMRGVFEPKHSVVVEAPQRENELETRARRIIDKKQRSEQFIDDHLDGKDDIDRKSAASFLTNSQTGNTVISAAEKQDFTAMDNHVNPFIAKANNVV